MDVKSLLPHREPFLFVDSLDQVDEKKIVARRCFREDEFFFKGHFPGYPVVPGVLLIETLAQVGGAGARRLGLLADDALFFLASVDKVKFRRQVRPGDTVRLEVENIRVSAKMIKQRGQVMLEKEVAAEAEWLCLVDSR